MMMMMMMTGKLSMLLAVLLLGKCLVGQND
jgi:hypothetical protein